MNYDELAAKVREDGEMLASAREEADRLRAELAWYDALDPEAAVAAAAAEAARISSELGEIRPKLTVAKVELWMNLGITALGVKNEFRVATVVLNPVGGALAARRQIKDLSARKAELEAQHDPAKRALVERRAEAKRHAAFDRPKNAHDLTVIESLAATITPEHEKRAARLAHIDEQIAPLHAALDKVERDIRQARNPQSRYVSALRNDQQRIQKQIAREKRKGTLDARKVVIDGSNFRFDDKNRDIKLSALRPLCATLAESRDVLVVFDANILTKLGLPDMDALQAKLPAAVKLHRAPSKTEADELILRRAREETTCVLSNDRYPEYINEPAVKEERVLRVSIMSDENLIVIPDLDLEVPYTWTR